MAGQSEATLRGARPGPAPSAESPLEPRAPSGVGSWSAPRASRLRALLGREHRDPLGDRPTLQPPRLGQPRLKSRAAQATLQICPGFS